mmetsp:Transcript_41604/g.120616  ORF Transcript_41604/g.120616 Transcript_41604/m.120616 type:complete len:273 (-) Transcript_41604:85-903(-)
MHLPQVFQFDPILEAAVPTHLDRRVSRSVNLEHDNTHALGTLGRVRVRAGAQEHQALTRLDEVWRCLARHFAADGHGHLLFPHLRENLRNHLPLQAACVGRLCVSMGFSRSLCNGRIERALGDFLLRTQRIELRLQPNLRGQVFDPRTRKSGDLRLPSRGSFPKFRHLGRAIRGDGAECSVDLAPSAHRCVKDSAEVIRGPVEGCLGSLLRPLQHRARRRLGHCQQQATSRSPHRLRRRRPRQQPQGDEGKPHTTQKLHFRWAGRPTGRVNT